MSLLRCGTRVALVLGLLGLAWPAGAQTQGDGARIYWKTLSGANAVTFFPIFATGNSNPFDPAHVITPSANVEGMLALVGAHKVLPVQGRSATLSVIVPVGNLQAQVAGVPGAPTESTRGFGDPMAQFTVNLVGAPAIRTLAEMVRYEPRFTVDLLGAIAFPVGEHDHTQSVNLGQNRWYGRIGAPMVYVVGPWVPGRRTTLEIVPALWLFADNDEYVGGTLENGPLFQLEGHLTRDFTETFWGSFDASWFKGGGLTVDGVESNSLNNTGVGFTFGFQVNQNLSISASYFSTVADEDATDLNGDEFRLSFTYGWHELLEGVKRLGNKD